MTAADGAAFWIDYDYDRENASDGISRYGAYVRRSSAMAESWDGTWDDAQVLAGRFGDFGILHEQIQALGRWSLEAFRLYFSTPAPTLYA